VGQVKFPIFKSSICKLYGIYSGYQVFRIPGYQEEPDCLVARLPNYLTLGTTFQEANAMSLAAHQ